MGQVKTNVRQIELTDLEDYVEVQMLPLDENGEPDEDRYEYAWTVYITGDERVVISLTDPEAGGEMQSVVTTIGEILERCSLTTV